MGVRYHPYWVYVKEFKAKILSDQVWKDLSSVPKYGISDLNMAHELQAIDRAHIPKSIFVTMDK